MERERDHEGNGGGGKENGALQGSDRGREDVRGEL